MAARVALTALTASCRYSSRVCKTLTRLFSERKRGSITSRSSKNSRLTKLLYTSQACRSFSLFASYKRHGKEKCFEFLVKLPFQAATSMPFDKLYCFIHVLTLTESKKTSKAGYCSNSRSKAGRMLSQRVSTPRRIWCWGTPKFSWTRSNSA